jgi:DNA-binding NarL/FixJ family response regulator
LTKDRSSEELVTALTKILRGEKYVSNAVAAQLVLDVTQPEKPPHELLSNREYQVIKMIAAGKAPRLIAQDLVLSPRTVNTYRARILQKLKARNTAEVVRYAIRNNLVH